MQPRIGLGLASGLLVAIAVGLLIGVGASPAYATAHTLTATIDEAQAMTTCDPNPAPAGGGGYAYVGYDDATMTMTWSINFSNLSGPPTMAHFHGPAGPGVNAGVQVTIGDLTSPSQGSAGITATQASQLLAGQWYINYHTAACNVGEIRGQVLAATVGGSSKLPGVDSVGAAPLAQPESSSTDVWFITALATGAAAAFVVLSGSALYAWRRSLR